MMNPALLFVGRNLNGKEAFTGNGLYHCLRLQCMFGTAVLWKAHAAYSIVHRCTCRLEKARQSFRFSTRILTRCHDFLAPMLSMIL
jgi:hypothetical protein